MNSVFTHYVMHTGKENGFAVLRWCIAFLTKLLYFQCWRW